ncbi:MAG: isoprenylcysteine carboxylmethyltransferase family protein [Ignavibacteria bacterium]|nr:isoprenylcysteine carboxylmethyltransferase family protein [Ignavibacteria bacterium]
MNIGEFLFKYRSYTPIPFLIIMLLYCKPNIISLITGFVLVLLGEYIRIWSNSWTGSETRTTDGVGGTYLVISGPYAFVRNPLYIGNIIIYFGLSVMSNALFPYLQVFGVILFAAQYYFIIKEEENFLSSKFGDAFQSYLHNVNRFIPKLKKYSSGNTEQPPYSFKKGFNSEIRSMQAWGIVALALILIWFIRRY